MALIYQASSQPISSMYGTIAEHGIQSYRSHSARHMYIDTAAAQQQERWMGWSEEQVLGARSSCGHLADAGWAAG